MSDAQGFWQQNCQVPFHGDRLKVGFHNEHHDFPNVAWGNLPKAEGTLILKGLSLATPPESVLVAHSPLKT